MIRRTLPMIGVLIGSAITFGGALTMTLIRYQVSEPPIQAKTFTHIAFLLVFAAPALWVLAARLSGPGEIRSNVFLAAGGAALVMGIATFGPAIATSS